MYKTKFETIMLILLLNDTLKNMESFMSHIWKIIMKEQDDYLNLFLFPFTVFNVRLYWRKKLDLCAYLNWIKKKENHLEAILIKNQLMTPKPCERGHIFDRIAGV